MRFDCAQTEIVFLRKRLAQLEERLEAELGTRTGLEQKASAASPGGDRNTQGCRAILGLFLSLLLELCRAEAQLCICFLLLLPLTRENQVFSTLV